MQLHNRLLFKPVLFVTSLTTKKKHWTTTSRTTKTATGFQGFRVNGRTASRLWTMQTDFIDMKRTSKSRNSLHKMLYLSGIFRTETSLQCTTTR